MKTFGWRFSHKTLLLFLVAGFLIGFMLAYGVSLREPGSDKDNPPGSPPVAESQERHPGRGKAPIIAAPETVIRPDTAIIYRVSLPACGEEEISVTAPGPEQVGLSRDLFAQMNDGMQITRFDTEEVHVLKVDDDASKCTSNSVWRTVGIKDGVVTVFYGRTSQGPVARPTGIRADSLPPGDRAILEAGVVVRGEEEVLNILEGMEQ